MTTPIGYSLEQFIKSLKRQILEVGSDRSISMDNESNKKKYSLFNESTL